VSRAERLAALVSAGARIEDPGTTHVSSEAIVEAGAVLKPFTILEGRTIVRAGAVVGPFVRLVDVEVGPGAQVLDHCLLRESVIEAGASVIGAGTITCNYDGVAKHPTRIEAGAFVGSDTTLVAPLTVGEGSYVAAGSTITEDVPKDALALGRARQVTKPGWAEKRRARRSARKDGA
jgi:bifunctional UDP-N-acetylglucosamine pyrophosphorylase/glucosamine-1-phosphate N-acetyltransferase